MNEKRNSRKLSGRVLRLLGLFLLLVLIIVPVTVSQAQTVFTVNSFTDDKQGSDGTCSLREAIIAANTDKKSGGKPGECPAGSGADTILLPAGIYLLSRTDNGNEDSAQTGDLDISSDITFRPANPGDVVVFDGNGISDRVFHVLSGTVVIEDVTVTGGNVSGNGGGLQNHGNLTISGSTFKANTASGNGGGLANAGGVLVVDNSTVSGNTGGGVANISGSTSLINVTVADNTGNGVVASSNQIVLSNSIVARNSGAECSGGGSLTSNTFGHNLYGEGSAGSLCPDNLAGNNVYVNNDAALFLGALANNGGPTFTHAITSDSPAFDAGVCLAEPSPPLAGLMVDQRNLDRPQGAECDIGAYELEVVNNPPTANDQVVVVPEDTPTPITLTGTDPEGLALTYTIVVTPSHGALSGVAPSLTYTPDPDYDGPDSFTFYVSDGSSISAPATVDIAVTPDGFIEVFNTANSGRGSLRNAINRANASPGPDTIVFDLDGTTGLVIMPLSPLPAIADDVSILGQNEDGAAVAAVIDGSTAVPVPPATAADGLTINGGTTTLDGVTILNFSGNGLVVNGPGGNIISNNNISFNAGDGVVINGPGGGNNVNLNTICNNGGNGVTILGASTNNNLSNNNICDNGGLPIDLGGDGVTPNDDDDTDAGPNQTQNYPVMFRANAGLNASAQLNDVVVGGYLNTEAGKVYTVEFFESATCPNFVPGPQTFVSSLAVAVPGVPDPIPSLSNTAYFSANLADQWPALNGHFITATATDPDGNTSELAQCLRVTDEDNDSWPRARRTNQSAQVDDYVTLPGQARWYKFHIEPGSKVIVTLTNLPANYNLTAYKDISVAYQAMVHSPVLEESDLVELGAEFAAEAFSAEAFSAEAFSAEAFSAEAFSAEAFSADAFSAEAFSAEAFSAEAFSAEAFSAEAFSAEAFSGAQSTSLLGVSAFDGTAGEGLVLNTWNNEGDFYVRVRSANGAFDPQNPFHLEIQVLTGECTSVNPVPVVSSLVAGASAGNYRTLVLTDLDLLPGDQAALNASLAPFNAQENGVVVDIGSVGAGDKLALLRQQALDYPECPYAMNLLAEGIKEVADAYRDLNPLENIVIIGDDRVIPFFRYPDNALLANENNYVPPVKDLTTSQAALRFGFVLGQDAYGSSVGVSLKSSVLPIPEIPVGRLVDSADRAKGMIDAYMELTNGVVTLTGKPAVTGYDFLADAADKVKTELEVGTGQTADFEIAAADLSPEEGWTADDMRDLLLNSGRHDLVFLAGHFSASGALAADYSTRMAASELIASPVDLKNAIVFSAGCHSGYNIVDLHGVPLVTEEPDWAEAFNQKLATLFAGTGYQYGDTEFLEYSERLYLEFSKQLRVAGPVSVGQAMVASKQIYLAGTPQMRGIHEKVLLESTLFGLPMLSVNLPGPALPPGGELDLGASPTLVPDDPGNTLGLLTADVTLNTPTSENEVILDDVNNTGSTVTSFYLSGDPDGRVLTNPAEPALPLHVFDASEAGTVLRGVGFRGGSYTDMPDKIPFTGAPVTEIRGVHGPFYTGVFYPVMPWRVNYYDALDSDIGGSPSDIITLALTPAQFMSDAPGSAFGTFRAYDDMSFRVYYSSYLGTSGVISPALAAAPSIVSISGTPVPAAAPTDVEFDVVVTGNPAVGIEDVWVSYTSINAADSFYGQWQSLDLSQSGVDSTLWQGALPLAGANHRDVRYIVQAANGLGLVSLATNLGAYYIPGGTLDGAPTSLAITANPGSGPYGTQAEFKAVLTRNSDGALLDGETVSFTVGPQSRLAEMIGGEATATLSLMGLPGLFDVQATFAGSADYAPSAAASPFTINKQATELLVNDPPSNPANLVEVKLQDITGQQLGEKTVFFVINEGGPSDLSRAVITDYAGRAGLSGVSLAPGSYTVTAYFSGQVPLHTGDTLNLTDARYLPATKTMTLVVNQPPDCSGAQSSLPEIWPLGNKFVSIDILNVSDPEGFPVTINIDSIIQDEAVGNKVDGDGIGTSTAQVRAERDGNGDGRVYAVGFTATDAQGASCTGTVYVPTVPHDQSGSTAAIYSAPPCWDSTIRFGGPLDDAMCPVIPGP